MTDVLDDMVKTMQHVQSSQLITVRVVLLGEEKIL